MDVEVQLSNGELETFSGQTRDAGVREALLSRRLKLSDHCRVSIRALTSIQDGRDTFVTESPGEWKTLREYADTRLDLRELYDPTGAYAALGREIGTVGVAGVFIVGGAIRQILRFFESGSFSLLGIVGLGGEILGFAVAGVIVGRLLGVVLGGPIGAMIGATRQKELQVPDHPAKRHLA